MASTFGGIELGKRALQTQQTSLDITGHNIANANNEDYSRQRAVQSTTDPYTHPSLYNSPGAGQIGTGVYISRVERMRDQFIDNRIRYENQALGEWTVKKENLREIESIFNELDESGLTNTLNLFWESFNNLINNPESISVRESVAQTAVTLTTQLNHIDTALIEFRDHLGSEINNQVNKINDLTQRIGDLNKQIKSIESDTSKQANDLTDTRDALVEELSKLVDIQVNVDQYNQANISINGLNIVNGADAKEIVADNSGVETITVMVDHDSDPATADVAYDYQFDKYSFTVGTNQLTIESGELKGLIDVRDTIVDQKVDKLDKLVHNLVNQVNYLHKTGYDLNNNTGTDFFTYGSSEYDAGQIIVNPAVVSDPALIAAAVDYDAAGNRIAPDPDEDSNGNNAQEIYRLRLTEITALETTFEDFWQSQADNLGITIDGASRMEANQQVVVDGLKQSRQEISGVSLDEEMTEMVKFQHGYNAAAKVVSKMDQMLETLINGII